MSQAAQIGFQFFQSYMQAREFTAEIDGASDKSDVALGRARMQKFEKTVLLQTLDQLWREHIVTLEHLRQVIGFRSYGQRDPLNEYKSEGYQLFEVLVTNLREDVTGRLMHLQANSTEEDAVAGEEEPDMSQLQAIHPAPPSNDPEWAMADAALAVADGRSAAPEERRAPVTKLAAVALDPSDPSTWGKVSRNAPCPCGSGKKYKHCHGSHA